MPMSFHGKRQGNRILARYVGERRMAIFRTQWNRNKPRRSLIIIKLNRGRQKGTTGVGETDGANTTVEIAFSLTWRENFRVSCVSGERNNPLPPIISRSSLLVLPHSHKSPGKLERDSRGWWVFGLLPEATCRIEREGEKYLHEIWSAHVWHISMTYTFRGA